MKMKSALISILLILTYSVGFAHDFIPHCTELHTEIAGNLDVHHDGSHNHSDHEVVDTDHSHIEHGDHYDDSYLDFFSCVLEVNNHHQDNCDNCEVEYSSSVFKNDVKKNSFDGLDELKSFQVYFSELLTETKSVIKTDTPFNFYTNGFIPLCPHRGPPSVTQS